MRLAAGQKSFDAAPAKHKAEIGDLVVMDFEGTVDGEPFEGGKGEGMSVELGSGRLIPGFEDQLVGVKANDEKTVNVTFPDDYPVDYLKGREAKFAVVVNEVQTAEAGQGRRRFRQVDGPGGHRPAARADEGPDRAGAERPHPHPYEAPAARPARRQPRFPGAGIDGRGRVRPDLAPAPA